jgi:hypothetical protein
MLWSFVGMKFDKFFSQGRETLGKTTHSFIPVPLLTGCYVALSISLLLELIFLLLLSFSGRETIPLLSNKQSTHENKRRKWVYKFIYLSVNYIHCMPLASTVNFELQGLQIKEFVLIEINEANRNNKLLEIRWREKIRIPCFSWLYFCFSLCLCLFLDEDRSWTGSWEGLEWNVCYFRSRWLLITDIPSTTGAREAERLCKSYYYVGLNEISFISHQVGWTKLFVLQCLKLFLF